ncbi:MAG: hypothetical protein ACIALR_09160 [Blastopirellula sp. JB062]
MFRPIPHFVTRVAFAMPCLPVVAIVACFLTLVFFPHEVTAQQPPYDNPPAVAAPYYRVRYDARPAAEGLSFPVSYTLWVPPHVQRLRGVIVHQHGCGEGSCKSGQSGAFDLHWQALASKHDCALLSPSYEQPKGTDCQKWCDPRNGSDAAFQTALSDLGDQCGHAELASVPWALWGHSGGGHWCGGMVMLHPSRVAAAWLRSGVPLLAAVEGRAIRPHQLPPEALQVPMMCNLGTQEGVSVTDGRFAGVWPANQTFFDTLRGQGALLGVAIDPLTSHECGNQRYLAIPWFDACLTARLPQQPGQPLRAVNPQLAWLAPLSPHEPHQAEPVAAAQYAGERATSVWLPNQAIAQAWSQYVRDTQVVDSTPPPAPTDVKLDGDQLSWSATADLESGIAHFLILRNGKTIAQVPQQPNHRFGRPLFQGLQYSDTPNVPLVEMRCQVEPVQAGEANPYQVKSVNTAGMSSP